MRRINKLIFNVFLWGLLSGGILTAFSLSLLMGEEIYDYKDSFDGVQLPAVDAIVCLAGGKGRIAAAGDLWQRYFQHTSTHETDKAPPPPMLYISGMGPTSNYATFLTQIRKPVAEFLTPGHVFLETESTNTLENATVLAQNVRTRGWKSILLVTSPYHMKRAQWVISHVFSGNHLDVRIETYTIFHEPFESKQWRRSFQGIRVTIEEYVKWLYYQKVWPRFWRPEPEIVM